MSIDDEPFHIPVAESCVRTGMINPVLEATLGNRTAAWPLLFIANYGEGHALRIARTFDLSLSMVQRQLLRLEANGILVSRMVGNARIFSFNERNPTVRNLRQFLAGELNLLPDEVVRRYYRQLQRPRRSGKPL